NLTQRTLEHFYFWGLAERLRAARIMPTGYPISGITAYESLMGGYWYAPPQGEVVRKFYFQDADRLPQYCTEEVLRAEMARLPNVESRFGWSATAIEQDGDAAQVAIAEEGGDGVENWEADYLVGCDGARSLVRGQVGIGQDGA